MTFALPDTESTSDTVHRDPRDRVIAYLRSQLLGPLGGRTEVVTDPPRTRYLLGILFPQQAPSDILADVSDASLEDEGSGKSDDTTDGVPDEDIASVNDWFPSSLGLSFYLTSANFSCDVWGARYELGGKTRSRSWIRQPIAEDDRPETVQIAAPSAAGGQSIFHVLERRATLNTLWRKFRDGFLVTVTLINSAKLDIEPTGDLTEEERILHDANCLHQIGFRCVSVDSQIGNYPSVGDAGRDDEDAELRLLYLHTDTFAIGHGCSVSWRGGGEHRATWVSTEHLPTVDVPALTYDLPGFDNILTLSNLMTLDLDSLRDGLNAFVDSYEGWAQELNRSTVPDDLRDAKARLLERIDESRSRMRAGVVTLAQDSNVLSAFQQANRAMLMQMYQARHVVAGRSYSRDSVILVPPDYINMNYKWRPFQLAFQLLTLASIANETSPDREIVDLIWFPTGGGKTEAYLAMAAFSIFLRRLRDPERGAGTTVITRYTLTLLTAQQFQRAATLVCAMEMIRRETGAFGETAISIGLWIGDRHSPNRFVTASEKFNTMLLEDEPANPFQLQQCPWCGTDIVPVEATHQKSDYGVRADDTSFAFYCPTTICPFHIELPINVVDEALYNSPPSILLATVDKFAQLPWDDRANAFFGGGTYHPPALIIQDELHLLSGPLGTTVGLYECAIDILIGLCGTKPKIIASTATIRRAGDQVQGLFGRHDTRVFPPAGIDSRDSYFAQTTKALSGRRYVGIMPQSHSTQTSVVNTMTALLLATKECDLSDEERDAYWTVVAYHNSLRELGRTVTLARDDIPERLKLWASKPELERPLTDDEVMELRSNVGGDRLPKMLLRLGKPMTDPDCASVVACTNMFSVGVDVQRLGVMLMNGQPKSTSEYIQATSRVGRGGVPGLVAVLYGATRPRDRSHYEQFVSFHSALYRKVEPTSVTPFSPPSRKRALHAVFVILMRHWGGFAADDSAKLFDASDPRVLRIRAELLNRAGMTDPSEQAATESALDGLIEQWNAWATDCRKRRKGLYFAYHGKQFTNLLSDFGKSQGLWPTLRSMRNVDDEVDLVIIGAD